MSRTIDNTYQKGAVRCIIFKEKNTWFGVALEFNIVETGNDSREVMILLDEAIRGYVASGKKARLRGHILNQEPDPEYEKLWEGKNNPELIPSPIQVHSFSERSLSVD